MLAILLPGNTVEPTSIWVDTFGTAKVDLSDSEIASLVSELFDLRPFAIEARLKLRQPIYRETAAYGHMGREPRTVTKTFRSSNGTEVERTVELFTWERLDSVEAVRERFGLTALSEPTG